MPRTPSSARAAAVKSGLREKGGLAVAADTANGGLAVSATGEANKTVNWVARILSAEVLG